MSYNRIAFDNASRELSKLIIEGASLAKDPWVIASSLELVIINALIFSESALAKDFGEQGTFEYLDEMQTYIRKYFKDFDYKS